MKRSELEGIIREEIQNLLLEKERRVSIDKLKDIVDDLDLDDRPAGLKALDRALQMSPDDVSSVPLTPQLKAIVNRSSNPDPATDFLASLDKSDSDIAEKEKIAKAKAAAVKKLLDNPQPAPELDPKSLFDIKKVMSSWNPFPGLLPADATPEAKNLQRERLYRLMTVLKNSFQARVRTATQRHNQGRINRRDDYGLGTYAMAPLVSVNIRSGRRSPQFDLYTRVPSAQFITYLYFQAKYPDLAPKESILSGIEEGSGQWNMKPVTSASLEPLIKRFKSQFRPNAGPVPSKNQRLGSTAKKIEAMFRDTRVPGNQPKPSKYSNRVNPESDIVTMFDYYMRILDRVDVATGGALKRNVSFDGAIGK